jgi:hypothetical protein
LFGKIMKIRDRAHAASLGRQAARERDAMGQAMGRGDRLKMYLFAHDPTGIEWLEGSVKIGMGAWYVSSPGVFDVSPHLYDYARQVLSEPHWGLVMLALGVTKLVVWYYSLRTARFVSAITGAFFWGFYGFLLWYGDHRSPALVVWSILAVFEVLAGVWLHPRKDAGES